MYALRRFERWIGTALEDGLAFVFGGRVQATDLARRLAAEMADRRRPGAGRIYVPNRFTVHLAPRAWQDLDPPPERIAAELATFVTGRAAEEGEVFVGRVAVQLVTDPSLRGRRVRIDATFSDHAEHSIAPRSPAASISGTGPGELGDQFTAPMAAAPQPLTAPPLVLVVGQRRIPIAGQAPIYMGRALENELVLDHPSVSRRHARLAVAGQGWEVEDLGSATGLALNGRRISRAMVRPGDTLQLGRIEVCLAPADAAAVTATST